MSDFLKKFTTDNYDDNKLPTPENTVTATESDQQTEAMPMMTQSEEDQQATCNVHSEETEFDPSYQRRQRKKYMWLAVAILVLMIILGIVYYRWTHIKVPNFVEEEVATVRTWGTTEKVNLTVEQGYSLDIPVNHVISQTVKADKYLKRSQGLTITASLGADPQEQITLPDFAKLSYDAAKQWVAEQQAENISLIESYDEAVKKGTFIKQEAANKELKLSEYRRKDRLSVYYSKGKETFEKNIEVPDFKGKILSEVKEWAQKNEVKIKTEKEFSETVEKENILAQSIEKGQKIAKHDTLTLKVSQGQAIEVPNFANYTMDQAIALDSPLQPIIKSLYSEEVGYGRFLTQSVEAGKQYAADAELPKVEVIYSQGQPYLNDLRGTTVEGELPKLFFEEYQSKGANINYTVYYVDGEEPKGTVVKMSHYGQFLPLECTVEIGISRGNLQPKESVEWPDMNEPTADSESMVLPESETSE